MFATELIIVELLSSPCLVKPSFCEFKSQNRQQGTARCSTGHAAKCIAVITHWDGGLLGEKPAHNICIRNKHRSVFVTFTL